MTNSETRDSPYFSFLVVYPEYKPKGMQPLLESEFECGCLRKYSYES